jgi:hypothetical protein
VSHTGTGTTQLPACPVGVHSKNMFFLLTTREGHGNDIGGTPIKKKRKKTRELSLLASPFLSLPSQLSSLNLESVALPPQIGTTSPRSATNEPPQPISTQFPPAMSPHLQPATISLLYVGSLFLCMSYSLFLFSSVTAHLNLCLKSSSFFFSLLSFNE